ncbi:tRNA (adenosine(37)-N6)-threonylcarbamoyltransferase complex dimerization subunit type 1 TsaB [Planctomycetota bacterium]
MTDAPLILAIETSSRLGSIALGHGPRPQVERIFSGPLRHSSEILPTLETLLAEMGQAPPAIKQVYLSIGPGSFTGLRIAVSMAKAMHLANSCQIVPISSLDTIAANVNTAIISTCYRIIPLLDAKRGQFFAACYHHYPQQDLRVEKVTEDTLLTADEIQTLCQQEDVPHYLLGDGLLYHQETFTHPSVHVMDPDVWSPRAGKVYELGYKKAQAGLFADPPQLKPAYLREALVTHKKK